jgi:hypothetical protein
MFPHPLFLIATTTAHRFGYCVCCKLKCVECTKYVRVQAWTRVCEQRVYVVCAPGWFIKWVVIVMVCYLHAHQASTRTGAAGGVQLQPHTFLIMTLHGGEWSISCPSHLTPHTHGTSDWADPKAGPNIFEKTKASSSCQDHAVHRLVKILYSSSFHYKCQF